MTVVDGLIQQGMVTPTGTAVENCNAHNYAVSMKVHNYNNIVTVNHAGRINPDLAHPVR